ncbi:hypothetical protein [Glutamicibacter sp. JC586]|uniref:hypothetical protein n=1 Tax=Glutamicibacter sp. JC586 TaxID=2590552 RepID=UPI001356F8D9|nr:hypothetical protein [Glutamicibacter sp. JC586]
MQSCRLYIVGASGSGTTTLGSAVADAWSVPHADSDDYFWIPTNPPYTLVRPAAERVDLMESVFAPRPAWVLSGSVNGWGEKILQLCDAVVFMSLEVGQRRQRAEQRESIRRNGEAIDSEAFEEFMQWSQSYDDPQFHGRSRAKHEAWLATLDCPILRLDSTQSVQHLRDAVLSWEPESQ